MKYTDEKCGNCEYYYQRSSMLGGMGQCRKRVTSTKRYEEVFSNDHCIEYEQETMMFPIDDIDTDTDTESVDTQADDQITVVASERGD